MPRGRKTYRAIGTRRENIQLSSPYVFPGEANIKHMVEPKGNTAGVVKTADVKFSPHTWT
jgi:hypothetical protein